MKTTGNSLARSTAEMYNNRGGAKQQQVFSLRCANLLCLTGFLALGLAAISLSSSGSRNLHKSHHQRLPQLDLHELNTTLFSQAAQDDPWTPDELHRLQLLLASMDHHEQSDNVELVKRRWRRSPHSTRSRNSARLPLELTHPRYSTHWAESSHTLVTWLKKKRFDPGVMKDLLDQIKRPIDLMLTSSNSSSRRFRQCAVVGNSGILLEKDHGSFIDTHEAVLRINNAIVKGFEKHVGSKTSISFINSNVLGICSRRPGCSCSGSTKHPTVVYMCQALHFVHIQLCNPFFESDRAPLLVTDPRLDTLCMRIAKFYSLNRFVRATGHISVDDWKRLHDGSFFHYSSGMEAVMLALGMCDVVNLFGFGKSPTSKHHYHTNQRGELNLHDYAAEYDLYQDLARNRSVPFLDQSGLQMPAVNIFT